jgi:hypothetical protein
VQRYFAFCIENSCLEHRSKLTVSQLLVLSGKMISMSWIGKEMVVAREVVFVNSTGLWLKVNTGKIKYLLMYNC